MAFLDQHITSTVASSTGLTILAYLRSFALQTLQCGPIPRHVAFILDGNRHFARKHGLSIPEGHSAGADRLFETLDMSYSLGITEVSAYLFSIENFKRGETQVSDLMTVIESFIRRIAQPHGLLKKHGIQLRIIGRLEMVSSRLRSVATDACTRTAGHSRGVVNLFIAYTGRDEIATAVQSTVVECSREGKGDVVKMLDRHMLSANSLPVDLLVRTSSTRRLSDFMLWQCHQGTEIMLLACFWPAFTVWHLFWVVLRWQARRGVGV
ncbi:hypothetical protein ANOM_004104 [Aspergillus nomiae NRRL 13137]|uniref:Alkyl transferase n=1 Tax=Aspergillus nomiae NRRL (strain ATCC 15546 / NRRL 13137 / CBS 260.88 / M93) TaxID=1509407 RepID=A0A0L1J8I2_ASPN3|nr:uncharacterized protein ANOM_004104 [Aspergillus nomiae NRRL 13137]KNG88052.1 hypothetical protein ANOM_004104 [Aspergillus nomiae NRRL 13137]